MIPAWSDARKMVRRQASKLTEDGEESDRSSETSSPHPPSLISAERPRAPRKARSASSGLSSSASPPFVASHSPSLPTKALLPANLKGDVSYGSLSSVAPTELKQNEEASLESASSSEPPLPTSSSPSSLSGKPPPPDFSLSSDLYTFYTQLSSSPFLSSLLLFCPLGLASSVLSFPDIVQFVTNFLAIIPLAWLLGMVTEEIALRTSQTVGALLNATFGNAVELIVSVVALRKGFVRLVQTSLLGSVLSNLLLVLGTSFLLGGLRYEQQQYNRKGAAIFASMLLLACLALAVPSAYVNAFDAEVNQQDVLDISRITAVIIFAIYLLYLYFQLFTHTAMFKEEKSPHSAHRAPVAPDDASDEDDGEDGEGDEDEEEDEEPLISLSSALFLLLVITLLISFCSDNLIDSIAPVTRAWNINESFIGIILLPIVGNAAEHATAVTCALKNKLDLSIGVAVGSSTQIALFVIPFVTLLGWAIGQPMTLNFSEFEMIVLVMSVLIVNFLVKDGESNWLLGCMLIASYAILATSFYFYPILPNESVASITTSIHKTAGGGD